MADLDGADQAQRIAALEQELSQAQEVANTNQNAASILSQMMEAGEVEQDGGGNVRLSRRRSDTANVIGNLADLAE